MSVTESLCGHLQECRAGLRTSQDVPACTGLETSTHLASCCGTYDGGRTSDGNRTVRGRRLGQIVGLLVERVSATRTTGLTGLEWTAPAAPFFRRVLSERAVWANGPRSRHSGLDDPLAYYVA